MRLVTLAFVLLAGIGFATAFPTPYDSSYADWAAHGGPHENGDHSSANGKAHGGSRCKKPLIRREWLAIIRPSMYPG